jgi:hypothetical protein
MPAPEIIHQLVAQFTQNRDAYRSGRYNEAQLRQEFLNPFFEALGWDMVNRSGYAPQNREVIHEDSIDVEGGSHAPDYCFRLGQTRKFFVEAKKPVVDIQYDIHPAYQLRRYAWNVHLPLSILTDFEEFAVYDCRNKPNPSDSAATPSTRKNGTRSPRSSRGMRFGEAPSTSMQTKKPPKKAPPRWMTPF